MTRPRQTLRRTASIRLTPLVAAMLCAVALPASASHIGEELNTDQQAVQSGDQLLDALAQYEALPGAARSAREAQLVQLAAARRDRLLRLMARNPQLAALRFMPPGLRERFPAAARAHIEEPATVSGSVFASVADDFERGVARKIFHVRDASGGVYTLRLADPAGGERDLLGWTGRSVRLQGTRLDGNLVVSSRRDVQLVAADGSTTTTNVTPTMTPVVTGDQKTLVVLANFSDAALTCTAGDVATRVFGSTGATVNNGFREASRGLVSFSGQVVGPFNIPYSAAGSCDYSGWAAALDAQAKAAGLDLTQFRRIAYVTPRNSTCGWSGLAYMPGKQSWVQSCTATGVYQHELGHNVSLHHAGTPTSEYGDASDPMGGARVVRNNAANQVMAGWVPTGGVLDVTSGGSYAIQTLGVAAATSPQVLRLVKADTNERYYVSLRSAEGLDANLPTGFLNAVSIHRASGTLPAKTFLLQTLTPGTSFVDSVNGITVTLQGVSGGVATVGVSFSGSTCERRAPTLTLSPASATAAPGGTASFTVSLTNNNTAACGGGSFALAQTLPAGFSGVIGASPLAVAAGASATTSWRVTSATATPQATYTLDLTAGDGGTPATAHASVTVYQAPVDTTPPTLAVTSPAPGAVLSGNSTTIAASASDASGVARVEFYVDGRLLASDTSAPYSASWNLRKVSRGTHTLRVRALDAMGNAAEQQFSVTRQ